ncbi:MAG TPA: DUF3800 domain-containing protein [Clostridiaceae bacterium]|nr:DUF3800 domain-containing protein [Clostridiaceae bacterium]
MQKRLSIFVDESGDFGYSGEASRYYIFTLLFHNQAESINKSVAKLDEKLIVMGLPEHCIHSGAIIRRESHYKNMGINRRRKIIHAMRNFARNVPVIYHTFIFDKDRYHSYEILLKQLAKELGSFIQNKYVYFAKFEKIILYYDNGQTDLGMILNTVFNTLLNIETRKIYPEQYRLFQLADYICTLELINLKKENKMSSSSEIHFFYKPREFSKLFMKDLRKLRFDSKS